MKLHDVTKETDDDGLAHFFLEYRKRTLSSSPMSGRKDERQVTSLSDRRLFNVEQVLK
jgi:hypothetical protein